MKILDKKSEKMTMSNNLVSSLCCTVKGTYGGTAIMQHIMKAQVLQENSLMSYMMARKRIEIRPDHPIIESLQQMTEADKMARLSEPGSVTISNPFALPWLLP